MRANIVFLLALTLFSCQKNDKKPALSPEKAQPQEKIVSFEDFGKEVKKIVKSQEGIFRGMEFGFTPAEVRGTETAYHLETGEDYITYGMDFNLDENADFDYFFDKDSTLQKIETVIYFSSDTANERVFKDFIKYYDWKIGDNLQLSPTEYFWETPDYSKVKLKTVSRGISNDIIIEFTPAKKD